MFSVDIDVVAQSRKKGREWELVLTGRTKGLPDGAIVTLRFSRIENRVRWKDRALLTVPEENSWVRKAYVERNAFAHTETFDATTEVGVEIGFLPDDQESPDLRGRMGADYRPLRTAQTFRVGRPLEVATRLRKDYETISLQREEASRILKAVAATRSQEEMQRQKKDLDKLLRKVREERSVLAGSARALETILMDVYGSIGTLARPSSGTGNGGEHEGGTTSALTGATITLETIPEVLNGIRDVADREAGLLLFREAHALRSEATAVLAGWKAKPDRAAWDKHEANFDRDLNALRNVWRESKISVEGMTGFLDAVEIYLQGVTRAVESSAPDPALPEEAALQKLELRLRNAE